MKANRLPIDTAEKDYQGSDMPIFHRETSGMKCQSGLYSPFFSEEEDETEVEASPLYSSFRPLRTIVRIPDFGESSSEEIEGVSIAGTAQEKMVNYPSDGGKKRRSWARHSGIAVLWVSGFLVGLLCMKFGGGYFNGESNEKISIDSGEYQIAEIDEDSAGRETEFLQAPSEKKFALSVAEKEGSPSSAIPEWDEKTLDMIDSIPRWQPEMEDSLYAEDESAEEDFSFQKELPEIDITPAETASIADQKSGRTGIPQKEEIIPAGVEEPNLQVNGLADYAEIPAPFIEKPAMMAYEESEILAAVPKEFAEASDRPMKNQAEYFEPFETNEPETKEISPTRIAASENFYNDSYGAGGFSNYVPPKTNRSGNSSAGDFSRFSENE